MEAVVQSDSLFGHLAGRFSGQPENLATEALNYIINRSAIARHSFMEFVGQAKAELPDGLMFRTQAAGSDNAIPDLVGTDSQSRQVLLIEAKFWAGLTGNQPVTYLKRLPENSDGLLLFIAPVKRFDTLWNELLRRCQNEGFATGEYAETPSKEFRAIKADSTRTLAVTSWRAILSYILRSLETEGEHDVASDVKQLLGLCERMDSDAFLPLRSEELSSDTGTRIQQYCGLVDDVTGRMVAEGMASIGGFRSNGGAGWYGRYMKIYDVLYFLQFSADYWSKWRATPIWLRIGTQKEPKHLLREALKVLESDQPPRLIFDGVYLYVPLFMPTETEKDGVVSAVFEQVREVAELLRDRNRPVEETEADSTT